MIAPRLGIPVRARPNFWLRGRPRAGRRMWKMERWLRTFFLAYQTNKWYKQRRVHRCNKSTVDNATSSSEMVKSLVQAHKSGLAENARLNAQNANLRKTKKKSVKHQKKTSHSRGQRRCLDDLSSFSQINLVIEMNATKGWGKRHH